MIRVLVAEDSPTARALLVAILRQDPGIVVVGEAVNGLDAVRMTTELKPDLVTMDIRMPGLDGYAATREIMATAPTPIIVVSAVADATSTGVAMQALAAGALAVLEKPPGPSDPRFEALARELTTTVRAMAAVRVVRQMRSPAPWVPRRLRERRIGAVALAASTGGPIALATILRALPRQFAPPILLVQHIARGFLEGFAEWLSGETGIAVTVAEDGAPLRAGVVHLGPEDRHLGVRSDRRVSLSAAPPIGGFRPSATHLFRSAAQTFADELAAVVLTGMGNDGVDGLRDVRSRGGVVIAQDELTSVIFGMPGAAVEAGLTDQVLPLAEIAPLLQRLTEPPGSRSEERS